MAIYKCKMCGGTLEIQSGQTIATCEYCGTQQTLPKLDDDRRANLYDRANHFRRNNEFDKAMGIYENILNEDNTDAEVYWSLVLCRYGIEYVEDPATHKRVPTVNRAQFTSVFDDDNYKSAIQYADSYQRSIYEAEAKAINEIQKGILAISQQEEPFDVFICYKESDNNGRRTPDSVLANDLYHQLTQDGFKVFFSRITLEDKLGSAYEPYIFAALNSAKVMVVLGTKPEHFNAVWVKNEWSRYLALIRRGQKKMLIPAYKDMDPYDLPEEFSHLQAQDMSKLGFMQDLIRGIKKITQVDEPKTVVKETVVKETASTINNNAVAPLLKRAFMFLEDGEWSSADEYCERVLDIDPENGEAYLGKLMAELRVRTQESLKDKDMPFDDNGNYKKALRFADDNLKTALNGYIKYINTRNENIRLTGIYSRAENAMAVAKTEAAYLEAAKLFESIPAFRDSAALEKSCREAAETVRKDAIYAAAKAKMKRYTIKGCEAAIALFASISGWEDADESVAACREKIEELKAQAEARRLAAEDRKKKLDDAKALLKQQEAIYAENKSKIFGKGAELKKAANAEIAHLKKEIAEAEQQITYLNAVDLMDAGQYTEAIAAFEAMASYKDSTDRIMECKQLTLKNLQVGDYVLFGAYKQDNDSANGKEEIEWLVLDVQDGKALLISKYALDCKLYNKENKSVTWNSCALRAWLNNNFINAAFSADDRAMIPTVTVSADKNPSYNTDPGKATQDKVFLLSIQEVNKYFASDSARRCAPTDYAVANGAYVNSNNGNCVWWLRSPGSSQNYAARVHSDGGVSEYGFNVDFSDAAVRPALWINLDS